MRYWVYPNPLQGASGCLIVPQDTLIDELPPNIQARFGGATLWRTIELNPAVKHAGIEVSEVLRNISQKGYHIAGIPIRIMEQWPGQAGAAD
jgi:hypothetical protein